MTKEELIKEVTRKYDEAYIKKTPKSQAALKRAGRVMPGGDSRTSTYYYPYPIFLEKGNGCRVTDVDGHEYLDFHNCYTSMIHGHNFPPIVEATTKVLERFAPALGSPTNLITDWAEAICRRVPSVERIRFCNSGTEAGMFALRGMRAFAKKNKILKIEGGFDGTYDTVVHPSNGAGLPRSVQVDQLNAPFNDADAAETIIRENKDDLACMVVEPMMGAAGQIPPKDGYLEHLREITKANGVLLLFDEVMMFRLNYGGMQTMHKIKPDMTMLGKIIGGGFPIGAWGGREDIMALFDPSLKGDSAYMGLPATAAIHHGGTFNANPVAATAGKVMLEYLTQKEIDRINGLGDALASGVRAVFKRRKIKGQITGIGSLQNLHFTAEPVVDYKTAQTSRKQLMHLVHLCLIERGIFIPARGLFALSTAITQKEIDAVIKAMDDITAELKPIIEKIWPELIA